MKTIKKTKLNFFTTSILSMLFVVLLSFHAGFSNTLEVLKRGEMEFRVTSIDYNLTVGSYSLMWDITPTDYRINTHLEAKGLASLFINYTLSETSTGIVQHKKLQWNRYEIWQKYDDATRNRYETTYQLPNQSAIKMGMHKYLLQMNRLIFPQ